MTAASLTADDVLTRAGRQAGITTSGALKIRDGSNVMYRLLGDVVARIGPEHTEEAAGRQVAVARWLASAGINVVTPVAGLAQPTVVGTRPVTWWERIPEHRSATPAELGAMLRQLHNLTPPATPVLADFDPLSGVDKRVAAATRLGEADQAWLVDRVRAVRDELAQLVAAMGRGVIHGDAWQGNIAVPDSSAPVLLDLEHVSLGSRDWDLIPLAVDYADFARLSDEDYHAFVGAYGGRDVIQAPHFRTFADAQELRWTAFTLAKAETDDDAAEQTRHRIACLRGEVPRPWTWDAF
ncbi:aminoglycoside phosphotransferase family protein [Amycolatopsis sp. PS_44_ISF1]|uniref:phosphotransferase enzyme family protein n=1 Tax=Amycolatopsis sp. PS_44_ISF1 TaxID=2974917 RepID=UPI0028DDD065|nr:aminoglycoside phosphotransferase family protein [Amycolatopsis sp. PS_44_ISF1]MDT8913539.1 aminoglycoside phosphotransferase family protein [Amycolatopsis sp. PS_44_ISF1]